MITIRDFYSTPQLLEVGREFTAYFGGHFFGSVPDGRLSYTPKERNGSHLSPYEETVSTVFNALQESIKSQQDLIIERWPRIVHKTNRIY